MRLLYITNALAIYGGLERVLLQKVSWLAEHDCEICVLTANQGSKTLCYPIHPDIQYYDLNILFYKQYDYVGLRRLIKRYEQNHKFRERLTGKIKEFSPDIIVCTDLTYIDNILRVKGDIPFVFESHASCMCDLFENDGLFRRFHMWLMKMALRRTDMVVALTEGDALEWRKYTSRVCVIPNVVSLNTNNEFSDCSAKSAIVVGRFTNQKDFCSLLQIWSIVHQRYPEWKLHVYGGYGEGKQVISEKIDHICANIVVHDSSPQIFEKYKENSMLLLTSKYEPFGLVLPEAMSCGLPVVAFDCPYGPAVIISDGKDGFLIKGRNVNDFADKVCLLIENKDMRVKMGKAGILSSQRYKASNIMPLWIQLFSQLSNQ